MSIKFCYIKRNYYIDHKRYINMLDAGLEDKQSHRTHLCIQIEKDNRKYYIPLRNNLGDPVRKFGRIGHSIPSKSRQNAGLDYRYALLAEEKYIEWQDERKIPKSQYRKIEAEYDEIKKEFEIYLNGYKKAAKKQRLDREPLFRVSSLRNFDI